MREYKIIFKNLYFLDLQLIQDIILRFTFSKNITQNIINEIYSSIFWLRIFPNRFIEYKYSFRIMTIKWKYKVFYKIDEKNQEVQVYRILFSSSNYDNIF